MAMFSTHKSNKGEKFFIYLALALLCALYLLFIGACEQQAESTLREVDEPLYKTAQADYRKGDYNSALKGYLKLIDTRKDSPQSHLEAGRIYLNNMHDNVYAIYQFKKFIEIQSVLEPDSNLISHAKQMIETAQKRMITSMPQSPYDTNEGLESAIEKLKQENYELKQSIVSYSSTIKRLEDKILAMQGQLTSNTSSATTASRVQNVPAQTSSLQTSASSNSSQEIQQRRIARSVEELQQPRVQREIPYTYTVKAGDTLSSISQKIYGTTSRWPEILRYNSSNLSSPQALRVGQVLKLPR